MHRARYKALTLSQRAALRSEFERVLKADVDGDYGPGTFDSGAFSEAELTALYADWLATDHADAALQAQARR